MISDHIEDLLWSIAMEGEARLLDDIYRCENDTEKKRLEGLKVICTDIKSRYGYETPRRDNAEDGRKIVKISTTIFKDDMAELDRMCYEWDVGAADEVLREALRSYRLGYEYMARDITMDEIEEEKDGTMRELLRADLDETLARIKSLEETVFLAPPKDQWPDYDLDECGGIIEE